MGIFTVHLLQTVPGRISQAVGNAFPIFWEMSSWAILRQAVCSGLQRQKLAATIHVPAAAAKIATAPETR
jgi:hypothetical protein